MMEVSEESDMKPLMYDTDSDEKINVEVKPVSNKEIIDIEVNR